MEHKINTKDQPREVGLMINQQCSIFPGRRQPSIFDDEKLNFCVRNVYRWVLFSIATGNGIITNLRLKLSIIIIISKNYFVKVFKHCLVFFIKP